MNHFTVGGLLATLLLVACQTTAPAQTGKNAQDIPGNLVRVDNSSAKLAYVDPAANFSKYTAILLTPLGVDNVEIIQPSTSVTTTGKRNWELTDADKQKLQQDFREAMSKQLSGGGYTLVDTAGDHVLQISAMLTRIAPNAPKDDYRSRPTGRSKVFSEGGGDMSVAVTFSDADTREVLALAKDTRSGSSMWGLNTSVTNAAEVRRMFEAWAMQIRAQLDRVRKEE
ncbi:MAG TPA: DUF3313 family protein [Halioglobus sp.]